MNPISKYLSQPSKVQEPLSGGLGINELKPKPLPTGLLIEDTDPEEPEKVINPIIAPKTQAEKIDYLKQDIQM